MVSPALQGSCAPDSTYISTVSCQNNNIIIGKIQLPVEYENFQLKLVGLEKSVPPFQLAQ